MTTSPSIYDHLSNLREVVQLKAVSGMAYPRAEESLRFIEHLLGDLIAAHHVAAEGITVETRVERASLLSQRTERQQQDAKDLAYFLLHRDNEPHTHHHCPSCKQPFISPDWDPFCSSCVEAGWDVAFRRGYFDALWNHND